MMVNTKCTCMYSIN